MTTHFCRGALAATICAVFSSCPSIAIERPGHAGHHGDGVHPADHAPAGVMADHVHQKGEWMFSYRYMNMRMQDNLQGSNEVSPETIATTVPNRFAGQPMQPPTLRVVPTDMRMEMHMLGAMYAPSDKVTFMLMLPYVERAMNHVTFQGGMGSTRLGTFQTESRGIGDLKLRALLPFQTGWEGATLASFGLSLPTGSTDETDQVLAPTGMQPTLRLPYPMQIGSGTYDLLVGFTHRWHSGPWGWGAQYEGQYRLGRNDEGYSQGDVNSASLWGSFRVVPAASVSLRLRGQDVSRIDGIDDRIVAPVQTADPARQGGDRIDLGVGVNLAGQRQLHGHRLSLEWLEPVSQSLNGPQLEVKSVLSASYQYAF